MEFKLEPIVYDLKCFCGKVCGKLEFPGDAYINEQQIKRDHEVKCDEHKDTN